MRRSSWVLVLILVSGCGRPAIPPAEVQEEVEKVAAPVEPLVEEVEAPPATRPAEAAPEEEPDPAPPEGPIVENARRRPAPPPGQLGTRRYEPSPAEGPHLESLPEEERVTGSMGEVYSITGKVGQPVGWFGILRGLQEDPDRQETRLLVEMKYFDGLTDTHLLCVSFNGAGDFVAHLPGTGHDLALLALLKVYGTVTAEKEGVPHVDATFVRQWEQGLYAFMMAYGTQTGNEAWREHNTVKLGDIYSPFPDGLYYYQRLGAPGEFREVQVPE